MKKLLFAICIFGTAISFADNNASVSKEERMAKAYEFRMKKTGGMISRPDVLKGKVVIFNAQTNVSREAFVDSVRFTFSLMRVPYEIKDITEIVGLSNAAELLKTHEASIGIFLLNDDKIPVPMLIAPEGGWAFVNIGHLNKDNPKSQFLNARTQKEIVRAILHACGGANSMYENSLMRPIKAINDLDDIVHINPPVDVVGRTAKYLPAFGISTSPKVTYRKACQEGWAPSPTNEYQKAIWDEIHSIPTNPMKIKYQPKK